MTPLLEPRQDDGFGFVGQRSEDGGQERYLETLYARHVSGVFLNGLPNDI